MSETDDMTWGPCVVCGEPESVCFTGFGHCSKCDVRSGSEERSAVVAWLRATPQFSNGDPDVRTRVDDSSADLLADAIERGEHLSPTRKTEE